MIKPVSRSLQTARSAGDGNPAILAERTAAKFRKVIQIEFHVVGDIKIKVSVVVVVAESSAGAPASAIAHARLRRYIRERPIAIVAIQDSAIEIGNIKIFIAVVVVVANGHSETPSTVSQSRLCADVDKCTVMIVAIKLAGVALAGANVFQGRSVDQQDVHPTIIVIVEHRDTAAHGLHDVLLFGTATGEMENDSGGARDIYKLRIACNR